MAEIDRFVLGAAQLGMRGYGIARDKCHQSDPEEILEKAEALGIRFVDSAAIYGKCEQIIGSYLAKHPKSKLGIISKLSPEVDFSNMHAVKDSISASTEKIGRKLEAFLIHDSKMLQQWNGPLGEGLLRAKQEGLTQDIGVSVYSLSDFDQALSNPYMTYIQAPFNVLDRRLLTSGRLSAARQAGRKIHLRSIYLQGLLLLENIPEKMNFATPAWKAFRDICHEFRVTPSAAAIGWAKNNAIDCHLVIGCDNISQLDSNANLFFKNNIPMQCILALNKLPQASDAITNPSLWPKQKN